MNKMFAVIKREYLQAVRRKMFIFMTIFFPVLMAALFTVPGLIMARGLGGKKVAVVDGTGALHSSFSHKIEPEVPDPKKALSGGNRGELPQRRERLPPTRRPSRISTVSTRRRSPGIVSTPCC